MCSGKKEDCSQVKAKGFILLEIRLCGFFITVFSFLSNMLQTLVLSGHPSSQNTGVSTMSVNGYSFAVPSTN